MRHPWTHAEQGGLIHPITKQSAQGCQGKGIKPYTIDSRRASRHHTDSLGGEHRQGERALRVQLIGVATARRYRKDEAEGRDIVSRIIFEKDFVVYNIKSSCCVGGKMYLYHFYEKSKGPFLSISDLPFPEARKKLKDIQMESPN